ncbi:MAG TPA: penicillin-binding transpeptidase domain-containing protein, partial [Candidatus Omnitrophota bacterium]|nr:penicillin-binding transpeptidase domain-containing protein [Candidatus Omnitrophota bacterium]
MYIVNYRRRAEAVFFAVLIFFIACIARLLYVQFFHADYLASIAKKQHNLYVELEPRRGTIYDANFKPQAVNLAFESVFAVPNDMTQPQKEEALSCLPAILKMDASALRDRLWRNKSFVWLARKVPSDKIELIKALKLKGIGFIKESKRCYPNGYLLSHVLGFAGMDNKGLEGIELSYDKYLKGRPGWALMLRDARRRSLNIYDNSIMPKDGYDIVLTIDEVIQYIAERELDEVFRKYRARGASIVVMDPKTGAVLAMANRPTYDLNVLTKLDKDVMRNRAICDMFEPGSVNKVVTMAAAIEEGVVEPATRFLVPDGIQVADHRFTDHDPHPLANWSVSDILTQSSNVGTIMVAQQLGAERLDEYLRRFGFGQPTSLGFPNEAGGITLPLDEWSGTSIGSIPLGQGISVTALQMLSAFNVVANDGVYVPPRLVLARVG